MNSVLILVLIAVTSSSIYTNAVSFGREEFSHQFFKKLYELNKGQNVVCSPLSAHLLLTLLHQGTDGETAKQLAQSLYLAPDDEAVRQEAKLLLENLSSIKNITLGLNSAIYISDKLTLKDQFKQVAEESFKSEVVSLDFNEPENSAKIINDWVDQATNHKINSIVDKDAITPLSQMILVNAVYFKGEWFKAFNKQEDKMLFHVDEKTEKNVDAMVVHDNFFHYELPELDAHLVEVPYKNKNITMTIIVPNKIDGLNHAIDNLASIAKTRSVESKVIKNKSKVLLYMPKFKITSDFSLTETLEQLGMSKIFGDSGNFNKIANKSLKVDDSLQKTFIEVNEEGTEAAAATRAGLVLRILPSPPFLMKVDKPFLLKIEDHQTRSTLFIGAINDP